MSKKKKMKEKVLPTWAIWLAYLIWHFFFFFNQKSNAGSTTQNI